MTPAGLPHSDIHGSKYASYSPWLFAGNRVLLRLTVARHPPYALGYLLLVSLFPWCDDCNLFQDRSHYHHRTHFNKCSQRHPDTENSQAHTISDFASCSHNFSFTFILQLFLLFFHSLCREQTLSSNNLQSFRLVIKSSSTNTTLFRRIAFFKAIIKNIILLVLLMNTNAHLCSQSFLFFENTTLFTSDILGSILHYYRCFT